MAFSNIHSVIYPSPAPLLPIYMEYIRNMLLCMCNSHSKFTEFESLKGTGVYV